MIMSLRHFRGLGIALLAAGSLAACTLTEPTSPQAVQASNPNVTYNYRTDQELLTANQNATTFCSQYKTVPRTANLTNNSDGSKTVVFECVRTAAFPAPAPVPVNPNLLTYSYRTDQELVQASQTASALTRLAPARLRPRPRHGGTRPFRSRTRPPAARPAPGARRPHLATGAPLLRGRACRRPRPPGRNRAGRRTC